MPIPAQVGHLLDPIVDRLGCLGDSRRPMLVTEQLLNYGQDVLFPGAPPRLLQVQQLLDGMPQPELPALPMVLPDPPQTMPEGSTSSWPGPVGGCVVGKSAAVRTVTFHLDNFNASVWRCDH